MAEADQRAQRGCSAIVIRVAQGVEEFALILNHGISVARGHVIAISSSLVLEQTIHSEIIFNKE